MSASIDQLMLTSYAADRLRAKVPEVVAMAMDGLDEDQIRLATDHLLCGVPVDGPAGEAARAVLEMARRPNNDFLLDLLLLHRFNLGLEERLPMHVAQGLAALRRLTSRGGYHRGGYRR